MLVMVLADYVYWRWCMLVMIISDCAGRQGEGVLPDSQSPHGPHPPRYTALPRAHSAYSFEANTWTIHMHRCAWLLVSASQS